MLFTSKMGSSNMSRNIMNITKWLPLETNEMKNIYEECKQLKISTESLFEKFGSFLDEFKCKNVSKLHYSVTDNEFLMERLVGLADDSETLTNGFSDAFLKLTIEKSEIGHARMKFWKDTLWKLKLKLSYFLQQLISEITYLFIYYGEKISIITLKVSNLFNKCITMDTKFGILKNMAICSNTCPYLMYPLRKTSITKLLQLLAQNRAELCCHKLIDCLLNTYKYFDNHDEDNSSENSSIEIYRAITKHMTPPMVGDAEELTKPENVNVKSEIDENSSFVNLEELILYEEQNVLDLLNVSLNVAPNMLGNDGIKKSKDGEMKINSRARKQVLDYYQQILWGEVGNFLEHIILWWGASPLSERPPHSSQHLREWITQFTPTADIPSFILSALASLSDALGVHVASTSWDQHFRFALVASKTTFHTDTGKLFVEMLQDLISLCNLCEITSDWIVGAPLEELPLVEQIPVLHRLDHSVHTTRLWAVNEIKKLANNWNVEAFFLIIHCDIVNCLSQLDGLRLTDHSAEIEKGGLGVHVQVCANMREKLVSEVKVNIQKLKETPKECVDCLASVTQTISLANLQMIFPQNSFWKQNCYDCPEKPSEYVEKYLEQILTPVLAATEDHHISNMILKLMCESWLDYIYTNKIKFSQFGAVQLLTDFAHVSTWLINCPIISQDMRKKMLKNEVLRRCEGVGRLLLRSPGEHIKMSEKTKKIEQENESPKSENSQLMPAEMYVPNQEQWLELRVTRKKGMFITSFCCGD